MSTKRYKPEQIVNLLWQIEVGFISPQHSERALGLYLLGAEHA